MREGKCNLKIKGGARCGADVVPGKKYCAKHTPAAPPKKQNKITTYALPNSTKFSGEHTVKAGGYDAYIASDEWKEKARAEKELNPNCSLCNRTTNLHTHHRTYVRCGKEKKGDLIVLCADCHKLFHENYKYDGTVGHFTKK